MLTALSAMAVAHRQECLNDGSCVASPVSPSAVMHHTSRCPNHKFPFRVTSLKLSILSPLCGDISLNSGPVEFRLINCCSLRNKGLLITDTAVSDDFGIIALTETHIHHSLILITSKYTSPDLQEQGVM